jgi:hypothetical protein
MQKTSSIGEFMKSYYFVHHDEIIRNTASLLKVGELSEMDIQRIWARLGDPLINENDKIEYDYSIPLYQKMILRFRREGARDPAVFVNTVDPCNQARFANYFGVENHTLFGFFASIKNQYNKYIIRDLLGEIFLGSTWEDLNSIQFYFSLTQEQQLKLEVMYNLPFENL